MFPRTALGREEREERIKAGWGREGQGCVEEEKIRKKEGKKRRNK